MQELKPPIPIALLRNVTEPGASYGCCSANAGGQQPCSWLKHTENQGETMVSVFTMVGGLSTLEEVEEMLRQRVDQPISTLAKWIVHRSIVCLQWRTKTMLPLFQFDLRDMSLRPEASAVVGELTCAFDDWELACWFTEPNTWLRGARPVERIGVDYAEVLMAARADRFVALG